MNAHTHTHAYIHTHTYIYAGEIFDTEEDPTLSTGKVHRWQWVPCGGVDWDPVSTG